MKNFKLIPKHGIKLFFQRFFLVLSILFSFSACQMQDESFDGILGSKAPAFTLTNLDGKSECLLDYKNKVIVLFFFGNSCTNCISIAPEINKTLIEPFSNRNDFAILGLDFFNGSTDKVKEFQRSTSFEFPLLQNAANVASNYKTSYNRIVVIDKNLNVVFAGTHFVSEDLSTVKQLVDSLLK